jgi:hypothetical protein
LLCGLAVASDPLYIAIVYVSSPTLRIADSLLHLFFISIGMLFLPFLGLRQSAPDSRQGRCAQNVMAVFSFLLAFCATGLLTARALVDFDEDPAVTSSPTMHLLRIAILGLCLVLIAPLSWLYRSDVVGQKLVVVTLAAVFPIAQLVAEIAQFLNTSLAGSVHLFELALAVEHIMFFATHYWPGAGGRDIEEDKAAGDSGSESPEEREAMLPRSVVRI